MRWYASAALDIPYSDWRAVGRQATGFLQFTIGPLVTLYGYWRAVCRQATGFRRQSQTHTLTAELQPEVSTLTQHLSLHHD